jgi:hypothetical protein
MAAAAAPDMGAEDAVARLKEMRHRYWMADAEEAIDWLRRLLDQTHILQLYQAYFPARYHRSKKSLCAEGSEVYSPREMEFFQLVSERLFPIADCILDEIEERSDAIPLETAALDPEGIEDWSMTWKVLFSFAEGCSPYTDIDWNKVQEWLPPGADLPVAVTSRRDYDVDWKKFFRRAARLHPRLKHLQTAIEVVAFSTGNNFLDIPYDMLYNSDMPDWTVENIDWLAGEWRRAQPIIKKSNAVAKWLEARPQRLADLIALYNACVVFKTAEEELQ